MWRFLPMGLLLMFIGGLVTGCREEATRPEEMPREPVVRVEATDAYLKHFGTPPQGEAGQAFARVGYLPSREFTGRLVPRPIFVFSEKEPYRKILEKLTSGDLIALSGDTLYSPFPTDLALEVDPPRDGTLQLRLTSGSAWPLEERRAAVRALTETALQFAEVERVQVWLNGAPFPGMPESGFVHDETLIADPGPPVLILMVGTWEEGESYPKEILVEFDRPVTIQGFTLYDAEGKQVEGDYFHSVFKMAVVLHPSHPESLDEGNRLRAEWQVVDTLGRANQGVTTLALQKYEH